jgi:hypothetical protein
LCIAAVELPVVLTVRVAVTADVPEIAAGCVTEHVGISLAPAGYDVRLQARATLPAKPPLGVIVIVELAGVPGTAFVTEVPVSANPGVGGGTAAVTVSAMVAVWVRLADVPVTVTVYDPAVVAACVLTVSAAVTDWLPEIAAGWAAEQVGGLDVPAVPVTAQVSTTLSRKPPVGATVIVDVPFVPALTLMGVPLSVKLGVTVGLETSIGTVVVSIRLAEVPVTVTV